MTNFTALDTGVFTGYLLIMIGIALWMSFRNQSKNTEDYFLASKSLPWWAVGGSLIASNISAEQMIGMAGSGFALGLGIATYEFMAAATLIVVAKYLLPVFINKKIYTMPQFLEQRFDGRVRTGLAIFWVLLFVFVNITSLFSLGSLAIKNIIGIDVFWAVFGLVIYSATFSIFGGLKTVVWTDVIQVVVLIFGGTVASVLILNALSGGNGIWEGLTLLYEKAPQKFDMIFSKDITFTNIETGEQESAYYYLPGIGVLIGGMWIANLYYWGFNQYIIQRTLAAKNLREAQNGIVFAAFLKLFIPFIVVIPGIAAFVFEADLTKADDAYPWVINNYIVSGFKGLVVAAIVAAIGSSISSMVNSTSTIYTLDIHSKLFAPNASEKSLVRVGRITSALAILVGALMVPALAGFDQIFQFIQEYTGFISPGILAVFLFGMFWKRTTTSAALAVIVLSLPVTLGLKVLFPEMAILDRMGISFLILAVSMVVISLVTSTKDSDKAVELPEGIFKTGTVFNLLSIVVLGILAVIYGVFW